MSEWVEASPRGPVEAGQVGGDIQVTEAYSRRWVRRHTDGVDRVLVIEDTTYGCQQNGRRWLQTQTRRLIVLHDRLASLEEVEDLDGMLDEEFDITYDDSYVDGPADQPWPTDDDAKTEAARATGPSAFTWRGEY